MLSLRDCLSLLFSNPLVWKPVVEKNKKLKEIYNEIQQGRRGELKMEEDSTLLDVSEYELISQHN